MSAEPLLAALPPALDALARSLFRDEVLARRALLAPWPALDFRSAWDERDLWRSQGDPTRRRAFEEILARAPEKFTSVDQPFFKAEGTLGTLVSPYPQLPDPEYWFYVSLWGDEETARTYLNKSLRGLGWETTLEFLQKRRHPGPLRRLLNGLRADRIDPRRLALQAHMGEIASTYA